MLTHMHPQTTSEWIWKARQVLCLLPHREHETSPPLNVWHVWLSLWNNIHYLSLSSPVPCSFFFASSISAAAHLFIKSLVESLNGSLSERRRFAFNEDNEAPCIIKSRVIKERLDSNVWLKECLSKNTLQFFDKNTHTIRHTSIQIKTWRAQILFSTLS